MKHCRARERRQHCSYLVLLQDVQTKMKLSDMAECGPGRVVQCHSRIPRALVEQDWKTLDVSVSLKAIKLLDTQKSKMPQAEGCLPENICCERGCGRS